MSLQAPEFFTELCLPFHDHTVVGNTYYAAPVPGTPLRLRIDFTRTIHADTYGGLRVTVVHPDRGEIDAVALSFLDHGTFHRRDEANHTRPNTKQYGTFDTHHRPLPGAWDASAPKRAAGRTSRRTPPPPGPAPADPHPETRTPRQPPSRSLASCCPIRPPTPSRISTPPSP
ncbi:hypothetical protein OIE75_32800 [Streptomyces sp. NBC_01723]|uniref:hypothetical protein n=1 Tax=Streptomyces sp. NBC_01723 TaxID=2975921 RepID=UPI002E2EDE08|nr:hypothetical protein [Streptomyces sp. NBC_01723]